MNELEIIKIAANVGGYLVMSFYLIRTGRELARELMAIVDKLVAKFLTELIAAIRENSAADAKLSEKIDAMTKGPEK